MYPLYLHIYSTLGTSPVRLMLHFSFSSALCSTPVRLAQHVFISTTLRTSTIRLLPHIFFSGTRCARSQPVCKHKRRLASFILSISSLARSMCSSAITSASQARKRSFWGRYSGKDLLALRHKSARVPFSTCPVLALDTMSQLRSTEGVVVKKIWI